METRVAWDILKQHNLRRTECRSDVLDVFLGNEFALNYSDLETNLSQDYDRVTLYRTLNTFLDKGILHKIPDDSGVPKFALCPDECESEEHHHNHVHFKCNSCKQTTCLEEVTVPGLTFPEGYRVNEMDILVQGTCPNCR